MIKKPLVEKMWYIPLLKFFSLIYKSLLFQISEYSIEIIKEKVSNFIIF